MKRGQRELIGRSVRGKGERTKIIGDEGESEFPAQQKGNLALQGKLGL